MKAAKKLRDLQQLRELRHLPLLASYKLDGIRATVIGNKLISRSAKPIQNLYAQEMFGQYEGFDGELIFGEPNDPMVYNKTYSAVMTHGSRVPVRFFVFDFVDMDAWYTSRYDTIREHAGEGCVVLEQQVCHDEQAVASYEEYAVQTGYEGIMVRRPDAKYKQGRSTLIEGGLIAIKRFQDAEAEIVGFEELMRNMNEPTISPTGYQVRSSHKDGKVPGGTLGKVVCRRLSDGVIFRIGTGFDMARRDEIWANQDKYLHRLCVYKDVPYGAKDAPRQPVWKGLRSEDDL
jgi:DNA ligase-1